MEHKSKLIFVIGMHRCGTSLVSNCLVENGFSIGKTKNKDKDWQNPNGYFENDAFTNLHNKLLHYNHSSWYSITKGTMDYTQDHVNEYRHILKSEFENETLLLIKDPRLSFFVDFLKEVCSDNYEYKFLFLTRNKQECCQSLSKAQNKNEEVCNNLYDITMKKYEDDFLLIDHKDILSKNTEIMNQIGKYVNHKMDKSTTNLVDITLYRNRKTRKYSNHII